jgi:hypothetical protein
MSDHRPNGVPPLKDAEMEPLVFRQGTTPAVAGLHFSAALSVRANERQSPVVAEQQETNAAAQPLDVVVHSLDTDAVCAADSPQMAFELELLLINNDTGAALPSPRGNVQRDLLLQQEKEIGGDSEPHPLLLQLQQEEEAARHALVLEESATPAIRACGAISDLYDVHDTEQIGTGSFSRVVTGTPRTAEPPGGPPQAKRAIKVVLGGDDAQREKVMAMMAHETAVLRCIGRHPAILRLVETVITPHAEQQRKQSHMVMELLKGDLFEFTVGRRRKLNEMHAAQVMKQLLSAVAHLHSMGVVHRDIKLENILVNDWKDTRLADFGLAQMLDATTADVESRPCGTSYYIAPEFLTAIDSVDGVLVTTAAKLKLVDLWSCGVTMFVLLAGRPPFPGQVKTADERKELLAKIDRGVLFPPSISAEAKDLISKLLARDVSQRITADAAQAHPWFGVQERKLQELLAAVEAQRREQQQEPQ